MKRKLAAVAGAALAVIGITLATLDASALDGVAKASKDEVIAASKMSTGALAADRKLVTEIVEDSAKALEATRVALAADETNEDLLLAVSEAEKTLALALEAEVAALRAERAPRERFLKAAAQITRELVPK